MPRKHLPLSLTHLYSVCINAHSVDDHGLHTQLMIMANHDDNHSDKSTPGSYFGLPHETGFEFSDFFEINDWFEDDPLSSSLSVDGYNPQNLSFTPDETAVNLTGISISNCSSFHEGTSNRESGSGKEKKEIREKVAFKTKSEIEVLDDGFKWRKYGKKRVKNSPNPRNYYKCSVERCPVKKRVERDKEDPHYVVTTYEGIHNHQGPHL